MRIGVDRILFVSVKRESGERPELYPQLYIPNQFFASLMSLFINGKTAKKE